MDQGETNKEQLKYLGKPISEINSLRNIFSEEELKIINKYGAWMEALAGREIEPITSEQKRFVEVSMGNVEPKSEYEKIWMKILYVRNNNLNDQESTIRKIPQKIKDYVDRHLLDIESRKDISIKEKSDKIIHLFCATCAAISAQPIPFPDTFILTPLQAYMATRLASIHGVPFTKATKWEILSDIAKCVGLGYLAQQLVLMGKKTFLPGWGSIVSMSVVYGMTFAIGSILNEMFLRRSKNKDKMTQQEIKEMWKEMKKEGLNFGKQKIDEIKSTKNIFKKKSKLKNDQKNTK